MDERFRELYQILFDNYQISNELPVEQGGLGAPPVSGIIRGLINRVDSEQLDKHLRADGKFLLLVNLYSMIYMPLSLTQAVNVQDLFQAIYDDIRSIVKVAADEELDNEISGHTLVNTIGRSWRNLKTTEFRLWGDK